jgi:transglutaminase-like putative cysteine protease
VLSAILAALSTLLYSRYFAGLAWLPAMLGAATAPAVVVVIANRRGWSTVRLTAALALLLLLYAAVTLYPSTTFFGLPGPHTAGAMVRDAGGSLNRLLTVGLPSQVSASLLLPLEVITWTGSAGGAILSTRYRGHLAPVVPASIAFVIGLMLTASHTGTAVRDCALFILAAVVVVVVREDATVAPATLKDIGTWERLRISAGRLGFSLPVVVVVTVATLGTLEAIPASAPSQRFDPRALIGHVPVVLAGISPLSEVDAQLQEKPVRQLFSVQLRVIGQGHPLLDRLRLVGLSSYDGSVWGTADTFRPAGTTLSSPPSLDRALGTEVDERIQVLGLSSPFLPTAGEPIRTTDQDVAFDPSQGDLLATKSGPGTNAYETLTSLTQPTDDQLSRLQVYRGAGTQQLVALPPNVPSRVISLARLITGSRPTPIARLRAIEGYLRSNYTYDSNAPPGTTVASVNHFLFETKSGQPEQFAAAFAILGRAVGLPTRIAVGYLLDQHNAMGSGIYDITSADAFAWPEADFQRYGWVPFNPMSSGHARSSTPQSTRVASSRPTPAGGLRPRSITQSVFAGGVTSASAGSQTKTSSNVVALGVIAGLLLLVFAVGIFPVLLITGKAIRRRRRSLRRSPTARVFGAWHEICDRLLEKGMRVDDTFTPAEVAERAPRRVGAAATAPIATMAPIVAAAVFGQAEPDEQMAREAWALEGRARALMRRDATRRSRITAAFDPRPLCSDGPRPSRIVSSGRKVAT